MIIIETIRAIVFGALPIACFTFLTVQWSIVSGRLPRFSDVKDLQAQFKKKRDEIKQAKKLAKQNKQFEETKIEQEHQENEPFFHKRKGGDLLYNKLLFFGGGFYGTMALFTYMIIEVVEILAFFGKIIDVTHWQFTFSIQFLVDLFVNSIMNIVAAFIWFQTLPKYVDVNNGFIWIAAAYLGYLGGVHFTQLKGDEAWQFLSTGLQKIKYKLGKKRPKLRS
ncbi:hypothetical protein [uncultured Paraglaciecola sp.]|uniref:hypothetical protein n=1 Tax=uncultured Paraglaciecola sp. TaxID=1765024 RepID=UPI0025D1CA7F|nr:hypothetical protein [uncultured Paraglaciecola sp.]